MCYIALVAVVDGLDNLTPEEFCFKIRHLSIRLHLKIAVETVAVDVFHDEEDLLVGLEDLKQFRDMVVVEFLHDFHFSLDRLPSVWLHKLGFFVDFDSNLLIKLSVQTQSYHCIRSLANTLADEVVV